MARSGFVAVANGRLVLDGQPFRHVGVNLRGAAYYGMRFGSAGDLTVNLDTFRDMGIRAIRCFGAWDGVTNDVAAGRIADLADQAAARGIRLIVSLTDLYLGSGCQPQGDSAYGWTSPSNFRLYGDQWFTAGYRQIYLPWVRTVVSRLRDHPGILAWEMGNELKDEPHAAGLIEFSRVMRTEIRAIDPDHLLCTGNNATWSLVGDQADEWYRLFDVVATHHYDADTRGNDAAVARVLGRAHLVTEAGYNRACGQGGREGDVQAGIATWFDEIRTDGYYPWGAQAQAYDIGDGDNTFGMDRYCHTDFDGLFRVYRDRAATLGGTAPVPVPVPPPQPGPGQTVTLCGNPYVWADVDRALIARNYPGPYDHGQLESGAFTAAICPAQPVAGGYAAQLIGQSPAPTLQAGTTASVALDVRNAGTQAWFGEGNAFPVRLATSGPRDRLSVFAGPGWISKIRIPLPVSVVRPGETVHFVIPLTAPANLPVKQYRETFEIVAERLQWIPGVTATWQTGPASPLVRAASDTVTLCGRLLSWDQVDAELRVANYPGPYDHGNAESQAYTNAACPGWIDPVWVADTPPTVAVTVTGATPVPQPEPEPEPEPELPTDQVSPLVVGGIAGAVAAALAVAVSALEKQRGVQIMAEGPPIVPPVRGESDEDLLKAGVAVVAILGVGYLLTRPPVEPGQPQFTGLKATVT